MTTHVPPDWQRVRQIWDYSEAALRPFAFKRYLEAIRHVALYRLDDRPAKAQQYAAVAEFYWEELGKKLTEEEKEQINA